MAAAVLQLRDGAEYQGKLLVVGDGRHWVLAVQEHTALGRGFQSMIHQDSDFHLTVMVRGSTT